MPRQSPPKKRKGQAKMRRRFDGGEVMDIPAVTACTGGTEKTTRARIERGLLPYRRWSGRIVCLRSEILEFLRRLDGVTLEEALANVRARNGEGP